MPGVQRITNERQAFAIGLVCGAGFAILENMLYEGMYAMRGGWSWGGVTLLRGLGSALHPIGTALVTAAWFRARERGWGELLKAYAAAVGLHTLWNGGFTAFVYVTGLEYYSASTTLSLYGTPVQMVLVVFLVALGLGLWWLLRLLVGDLSKGVQPDLSPVIVSRRSLAAWAFASALLVVPLGATLGPAWAPAQEVILAGLPTPTPIPTRTLTPTPRPTSTPAPSRTPTPGSAQATGTAQAVATTAQVAQATAQAVQATVSAADRRPVLLTETFDSNVHRWSIRSANNDYWEGVRSIENDKYRWEAHAKQGFSQRTNPGSGAVSAFDYYVTVQVQRSVDQKRRNMASTFGNRAATTICSN